MNARYTTHVRNAPAAKSVAVPLDVRLMHVAASAMFAGVFVAVVWGALWTVVRLPMFGLQGITVVGEVEHNNAVTLRANVVGHLHGNFFTIDLGQVKRVFESVPWVRKATVEREFPNRLRVIVQEHHPVAYWGDESDARLVNSFGEVFDANLGELEEERMPHLSGPDSQSQQVLAMYQALAPKFKELTLGVDSLVLTDRGSWRAKVGHGAVIELGRGDVSDVLGRVQRLSTTLRQVTEKLGRKINAVESADLRHENGYALRLRGVSTLEAPTKR
jgi:cell division protein FtsQ